MNLKRPIPVPGHLLPDLAILDLAQGARPPQVRGG
jgi:hypothetical protein